MIYLQGGQHCDYCQANTTSSSHPAENMVDGGSAWWQSPPLSRGMQYNFVNITIDLEQVSVLHSPTSVVRQAIWLLLVHINICFSTIH
jgi:hypothetical protein